LRTFLPTGYEPNYPYPLLVFLHGEGGSEETVLKLAPRLSRRNFICIGLRGLLPLPDTTSPAYSWGDEGQQDQVEEYILRSIEATRRRYHVHSERIYLAGFNEGSEPAFRLGLSQPEKFAGLVALNGCLPTRGRPLLRLDEVRRLRVLIAHGLDNTQTPVTAARADQRLLYTAGLDVEFKCYATNHAIHPDMLRDLNRWIIDQINDENDALRDAF
jgi:phospholipase/carboxylesterase